ncbi:hypothetical protein Ccrd_013624, partial [Cynara cardunculus var. scolymus]
FFFSWIYVGVFYAQFGSLWSIYGCYWYHNEVGGGRSEELDEAQAIGPQDRRDLAKPLAFGFMFFRSYFRCSCAYRLHFLVHHCTFFFPREHFNNFLLLPIAMHSTNVVFLLFETALNS